MQFPRKDLENVTDAYFFVKQDYYPGAKLIAEKFNIKLVQLDKYNPEKYKRRLTKMNVLIAAETSVINSITAYGDGDEIVSTNEKDFVEDSEGMLAHLDCYAEYFASKERDTTLTNQVFDIDCAPNPGKLVKNNQQILRIKLDLSFQKGTPESVYDYDASKSVEAEMIITQTNQVFLLDKSMCRKEIFNPSTPVKKKK